MVILNHICVKNKTSIFLLFDLHKEVKPKDYVGVWEGWGGGRK